MNRPRIVLIDPNDPGYQLGHATMDSTHQEFMQLVNRLHLAAKNEFPALFDELVIHTGNHFEAENQLMQDYRFPAIREHMDEHLRVLGELNRISRLVHDGSFRAAFSYVRDGLPVWFKLHAMTMDSALAAHITRRDLSETA